MIDLAGKRVFLACGHTDMRKNINGLSTLVECSFKMNPSDGALFVFCNRNRDRIKILEYDGDGYWLHFKRLERGHFRWPAPGTESTMYLTGEELYVLLSGTKVALKLKREEIFERKVM
jgi:transposase